MADTGEAEDAIPAVPDKPKEPTQLGTYLGRNDILLRLNSTTVDWVRLPEMAVINGNNTLLALPKYRTQLLLGNANLYLSGGTRVQVPKQGLPVEDGMLAISLEIDYGRMIMTPGAEGTRVKLKIGSVERTFDMSDLAYLAVDAHRVFVPGSDFENEVSPVEVHWYLTTGSVEWTDATGTTRPIEGPATWTTTSFEESEPRSLDKMPGWIDDDDVTRLDYRARDKMLSELAVGQPVRLRLEELNSRSNPNRELRSLSSEASLHVGEFDPVVRALNDSDQKPYWEKHIEAMRQALARNPENASRLDDAFRQLRGDQEGGDLMRMVRGFSPEEVGTTPAERKEGVVLDLITWLEHPSLDYRVLAIYNLDQIKGTKNLKGYSPDELQRSRDKAVARIRQMLENNEF